MSNAREINSRYDDLAEKISKSYTEKGAGNRAKRLLELANGSDDFQLPVTQEELAGMVGASCERVNKAIASFIRLGWLDQHDRQYTIKMRDRLKQRSR